MWSTLVKKILSWFCILSGLGVLVVATSRRLTWTISHARGYDHPVDAWWGQHSNRWGDLAALSYLDGMRKFREKLSYQFVAPVDDGRKNIDLYVYGDSYTKDIPASAFANLHSYHYQKRVGDLYYDLDTAYRNILLIEFSERFVVEEFSSSQIFDIVRKTPDWRIYKKSAPPTDEPPPFSGSLDDFFNPHINRNLELHLFDYNFLAGFRQWKADLNYKLFHRASGNVAISDNSNYLFLKQTVDDSRTGIYRAFNRWEVKNFTNTLNGIYDHYRQEGFDDVYVSIIPNPATILQHAGYNRLIPWLQTYPKMKIHFIDLYTPFMHSSNPASLFRAGDTHWNNNGLQIWIGLVNDALREQSKKKN